MFVAGFAAGVVAMIAVIWAALRDDDPHRRLKRRVW